MLIIIPTAHGQIKTEDSLQKSVRVEINSLGDVKVIHEIKKQNEPKQLDLLDGTITNLRVNNEDGDEFSFGLLNENSIMILPSDEKLIVTYDLSDALTLIDNFWTWNLLYFLSTSIIFPEEIDLVFVNDKPVFLGDKPGIICHGCQMKLEYSLDQPKLIENVKSKNNVHVIEIISWAKVDQFNFDKENGITFGLEDSNDFVTLIVPKNLLKEPLEVSLNDEKILFHKYIENDTHTWISLKPKNPGEVSISGTVVPEFPENDMGSIPVEYLAGIGIAIGIGAVIAIIFIKKKK